MIRHCLLCERELQEILPPAQFGGLGFQIHPEVSDCLVSYADRWGVPSTLEAMDAALYGEGPEPEPFFTQTHPLMETVLQEIFDEAGLPRLGGASTGRGWSSFGTFQRCPYAWKRRYIDNAQSLMVVDPLGRTIGTLVHTFLALYYVQMMPDSAYREMTPQYVVDRLRLRADPKMVEEGWRLFVAYRLYYQFENITPLAIEHDLRDPRTNESTRYDLIAFIDRELPGCLPGTYIVEHKTAQRFDMDTLEGWANDGEILGEVALWERLGLHHRFGPLQGIIVNIIGKQKEPRFHRTVIAPSSWQIGQHLDDLRKWEGLIQLARSSNNFPRARNGCLGKFGRCEHWDHCLTNEG